MPGNDWIRKHVGYQVLWLAALLLGLSSPATAAIVNSGTASIQWTAATGPVASYIMQTSVNGSAFGFHSSVSTNRAQISGQSGESWVVRVAAVDPAGNLGAWSVNSSPIRFVSAPPAPTPGGPMSTLSRNPHVDLIGDGGSDYIWRNELTGDIAVWLLSRSQGFLLPRPADLSLTPVGAGDFSGDGRQQILLHSPLAGTLEVWSLSGVSVSGVSTISGGPVAPWEPVAVLDADADGSADILWWNRSTGAANLWLMNRSMRSRTVTLPTVRADRSNFLGPGDYDGDGLIDVAWQDRNSGAVTTWSSLAGTLSTRQLGLSAQGLTPSGIADLNADGKSDFLWIQRSGGRVSTWLLGASPQEVEIFANAGPEWRIADASDQNGDGQYEILWRSDTTSEFYRWQLRGTEFVSSALVATADPGWEIMAPHR